MANPEHVEIVKGGEVTIGKWRLENPVGTLELIKADLHKADLQSADLNRADLRGADLSGADLSQANLREANLREADLKGANLHKTDLQHADLGGADLGLADLRGAALRGANLEGSHLRGALIGGTGLRGARLALADLHGAILREADLEGADLRGAYLSGANLHKTDLQYADLSGAYLSGADLSGADLSGADVRGIDLTGRNEFWEVHRRKHPNGKDHRRANLSGARLRGANLRGARLIRADLSRADLSRADLSRADLSGADLSGADLGEADLREAKVGWTTFGDVGLFEARGLETIRHEGPSTVGIDTLVRCRGRLPDEFLRGCGFTPWQIMETKLYDPALTAREINELQCKIFDLRAHGPLYIGRVFISYSHADTEFVDEVFERLQKAGASAWLDRHDMVAGSLQKQVSRAIGLNDVVLLVLSEASSKSDWVANELDMARRKEKAEGRDVLCPVALDDAWKSRALDLEADDRQLWRTLSHKNILDFSKWKTDVFDEQFGKLLRGLKIYYEPKKA